MSQMVLHDSLPPALPQCVDCKRIVDTKSPLAMWEVAGFVKARKRGVNAPKFKVKTGRWLCPGCAMKRQDQVHKHQEGLF